MDEFIDAMSGVVRWGVGRDKLSKPSIKNRRFDMRNQKGLVNSLAVRFIGWRERIIVASASIKMDALVKRNPKGFAILN